MLGNRESNNYLSCVTLIVRPGFNSDRQIEGERIKKRDEYDHGNFQSLIGNPYVTEVFHNHALGHGYVVDVSLAPWITMTGLSGH